jgi:hypothetical protein
VANPRVQEQGANKEEDDEMQKPSVQSSGCISTPATVSESHNETIREPLYVTKSAVYAHEKRTWFSDRGRVRAGGHGILMAWEELAPVHDIEVSCQKETA